MNWIMDPGFPYKSAQGKEPVRTAVYDDIVGVNGLILGLQELVIQY
jgi:hypothetical protein